MLQDGKPTSNGILNRLRFLVSKFAINSVAARLAVAQEHPGLSKWISQPCTPYRAKILNLRAGLLDIVYRETTTKTCMDTGHHYSVPFNLAYKVVDIRFTKYIVEILFGNTRAASHVRSWAEGQSTTAPEHLTPDHALYHGMTPEYFLEQAANIGPHTEIVVQTLLKSKVYPQLSFAECFGIVKTLKVKKNSLLILDDFALVTITEEQCRDMLEVTDDRSGSGSFIISSQLPVKDWCSSKSHYGRYHYVTELELATK